MFSGKLSAGNEILCNNSHMSQQNEASSGLPLLDQGLEALLALLGEGWEATKVESPGEQIYGSPEADDPLDQVVYLRNQSGTSAQLLVEARERIYPADVRRVLAPKLRLMRQVNSNSLPLLISRWLSPRTREVLEAARYNYLDLTGNVYLRVQSPVIVIQSTGAQRDPEPSSTRTRLVGPVAGRLVRVLVDVAPPYRAGELAEAADVSLAYVSRLLDVMEREALISRRQRLIVDIDWVGLLRSRAAEVQLIKGRNHRTMVAPGGLQKALDDLRMTTESNSFAVTGSFAAQVTAPVSVGGQLMLYTRNGFAQRLAALLRLLPTDEGANVVLIEPEDQVVFDRVRAIDGLPYVALSQLAIDLLSGPGRMPAEGEALLEYMIKNEHDWRAPSLSAQKSVPVL